MALADRGITSTAEENSAATNMDPLLDALERDCPPGCDRDAGAPTEESQMVPEPEAEGLLPSVAEEEEAVATGGEDGEAIGGVIFSTKIGAIARL